MPSRKLAVSLLSLTALICAIAAPLQSEDRAHPFRDYLVKSYPAQMRLDLPEDSLLKLRRSVDCSASPFSLLQSVLPHETDNRAVYAVHLGSWESRSGTFALKSSRWYVFRLIEKQGKSGESCTFVQTGFNADGTPSIYADKTVWLLGVDYFAGQQTPQLFLSDTNLQMYPSRLRTYKILGRS